MKHKNVNRARNVLDRAVGLLPRYDQFWLKYVYFEEVLGNYAGTRQVFERWMKWKPDEQAWQTYINFEIRHREHARAREIYKQFVQCHMKPRVWLKFAKFEIRAGRFEAAREVFQEAIELLGEEAEDPTLFIEFARLEEKLKEYERARAIYKFALDHIPKNKAQDLYRKYISFEKQYGAKDGIEEAISNRRRIQYEDQLKDEPTNYDIWFDYIRLEEDNGDESKVRDVYERAIAQVPPKSEKRFWRRYIYIWINYAVYEELEASDEDRARQVYQTCLDIIPHKKFSFAKIWIMFAQFELRHHNLQRARKVLGVAIGKCPKDKIFDSYIDLEIKLGNIDRCRTLYQKWLETAPYNCKAWCKFAELEDSLAEV